jgi:hypothetical protein
MANFLRLTERDCTSEISHGWSQWVRKTFTSHYDVVNMDATLGFQDDKNGQLKTQISCGMRH